MNPTGTADTTSTLSKKGSNGAAKSVSSGTSPLSTSSRSKSDQKETTLRTIFEDGLKDIYSAEQQLVKALPDVAQAIYSEELQDAIYFHLEQTKRQAERLEKVFSRLNIKSTEAKCPAMEGLIEEAQQVIEEYKGGPARDAALIIAAQKVEHYEIACYGSLCELADVLGYRTVADILDRSLKEERDTDHLLTEIAMDINDEAMLVEYESQNSR